MVDSIRRQRAVGGYLRVARILRALHCGIGILPMIQGLEAPATSAGRMPAPRKGARALATQSFAGRSYGLGAAVLWVAKNRTSLRPVCGTTPQFFSIVSFTYLAAMPLKLTVVLWT